MRRKTKILQILSFLTLVGCAIQPMTLDERMQSKYALANDVGKNRSDQMRYRVGYQYANAARNLIGNPGVPMIAILDYPLQDTYDRLLGIRAPGFAAAAVRTPKKVRNGSTFMFGIGMIAQPNTHYFLFDESPGVASAEDVDTAWMAAHALFSTIHNRDRNCQVPRWDPKHQYALTQPKNVRGIYKQVIYLCPNPVAEGETQTVRVEAWANPFDGVRSMGAVQAECWYRPTYGQNFVDVRGCGESLARKQRAWIPESQFEVIELITTPQRDDPSIFEVIARYKSNSVALSAPGANTDYTAFLKERPYSPDK